LAWCGTVFGDRGVRRDPSGRGFRVKVADGVVLRYGRLYGPGTYYEYEKPQPPRIQVDEAARRTLPALDSASGIVEVTDD
jgi:hypothetical protein